MPFKKGQSGNPGGAPRKDRPFKRALMHALEVPGPNGVKLLDALAKELILAGLSRGLNAMPALKMIRDTLDGLPVQQVDINESRDAVVRELSDRELHDIAAASSARAASQESGEEKSDLIH